jgi:hypothetical protein
MKNALHYAAKRKKEIVTDTLKNPSLLKYSLTTRRIIAAYQVGGWDEVDEYIRRITVQRAA